MHVGVKQQKTSEIPDVGQDTSVRTSESIPSSVQADIVVDTGGSGRKVSEEEYMR